MRDQQPSERQVGPTSKGDDVEVCTNSLMVNGVEIQCQFPLVVPDGPHGGESHRARVVADDSRQVWLEW